MKYHKFMVQGWMLIIQKMYHVTNNIKKKTFNDIENKKKKPLKFNV